MKKIILTLLLCLLTLPSFGGAGLFDNIMKNIGLLSQNELDGDTIARGLKEALSVGTENAVKQVSQADGYLANEAIKILMPEKIRTVADVLKKVGFQEQVDSFVTSMNRAAEAAAPKATAYFIDSLKQMTIEDAKNILNGGDTAATNYFKDKTYNSLTEAFRPSVSESMNAVGVTRSYKEMMDKYTALPLMRDVAFDLDGYVTEKSLDGLFTIVAEEEKKIRTDPAARVTDVLKKVFSR